MKPGNEINFTEAAKIIVNAINKDDSGGHGQLDIPSGTVWYEGYVRALASHNAIPTSITSFDQKITRGEMAEMIWRLKTNTTTKESQTYEKLASNNSSSDTMTVKLYFGDKKVIEDSDCRATLPVTRTIPKTTAVADAALRLLFQGVTPQEKAQGLTSSFDRPSDGENSTGPLSTFYQGVVVVNEVATVKFSSPALDYLNSAACAQEAVKGPIERTLLQFTSIKSVQYSIDGKIFTDWDA
jgi:hypothetical protein